MIRYHNFYIGANNTLGRKNAVTINSPVFQNLFALGFVESLPYPPKGDESHASRIAPPV